MSKYKVGQKVLIKKNSEMYKKTILGRAGYYYVPQNIFNRFCEIVHVNGSSYIVRDLNECNHLIFEDDIVEDILFEKQLKRRKRNININFNN